MMTNLEKLKEIIKETFGCDEDFLSDFINPTLYLGIEGKPISCQGFRCPYWGNQFENGVCKAINCQYRHFWDLEYEEKKSEVTE